MNLFSRKSIFNFGLIILVFATACSGNQISGDDPLGVSLEENQELSINEASDFEDSYIYFTNFENQDDWIIISGYSPEGKQFEPEVVDEGLKVEINNTYAWFHGYQQFLLDDSYVEVEVTHASGVIPSIELYCRSDEPGEYRFFINFGGFWDIGLFDFFNSEYKSLVTGMSNSINPQGEKNVFAAICVGNYLTLVINGEIVGEVFDNTFTNGIVGFGVQNWEEEFTEVIISNFFIHTISLEE